MAILKKGLVQVYTGDGKGKTTAAFGLAWRMLGRGGKVYICQFLKPADIETGEALFAPRFSDQLTLERLDQPWDMRKGLDDQQQVTAMRHALADKLAEITHLAQSGNYDLIVLDELVLCLHWHLVDTEQLWNLIETRAEHIELVLTGRGADQPLIEKADLVTVVDWKKHPFQKGIPARKGIEY